LGGAPATCLFFSIYERAKIFLEKKKLTGGSILLRDFSAGIIAELFSCVLWVPLDVIKERLQGFFYIDFG
jgi:hypothetical protein